MAFFTWHNACKNPHAHAGGVEYTSGASKQRCTAPTTSGTIRSSASPTSLARSLAPDGPTRNTDSSTPSSHSANARM